MKPCNKHSMARAFTRKTCMLVHSDYCSCNISELPSFRTRVFKIFSHLQPSSAVLPVLPSISKRIGIHFYLNSYSHWGNNEGWKHFHDAEKKASTRQKKKQCAWLSWRIPKGLTKVISIDIKRYHFTPWQIITDLCGLTGLEGKSSKRNSSLRVESRTKLSRMLSASVFTSHLSCSTHVSKEFGPSCSQW